MLKIKNLLISVALLCALVVVSVRNSAAQTDSDTTISPERMSEILDMAIHYNYNETDERYSFETDPVMQEVWKLRGEELRLYLDFDEAFELVSDEFFPPVGVGVSGNPNQEEVTSAIRVTSVLNRQKQSEIINIAQERVFGTGIGPYVALNELEQSFLNAVQVRLEAVSTGQSETLFSSAHFQRREFVVHAIEKEGYRLYMDVDEDLMARAEALEREIEAQEAATENQSCGALPKGAGFEIDYYHNQGNTGYYWFYAKDGDDPDCDVFIAYPMSSQGHKVDYVASKGECVLQKAGGHGGRIGGYWNGSSLHYGVYSTERVEWGWPVGCNTSGGVVQQSTIGD